MKMEDGARLRIQWSAPHGRTSPHNRLIVEDGLQASHRGAYICTACGELFKKTSILSEVNKVKSIRKNHSFLSGRRENSSFPTIGTKDSVYGQQSLWLVDTSHAFRQVLYVPAHVPEILARWNESR